MPTTLIRGGLVHDAVHRDACKADILLADGKIAAIGTDLTAPADTAVFDADGLDVFPGFVDAHTHIGLDGYGIGYEGCDYNEMNDIWTPQLRAIDGINPRDPSLADARKRSEERRVGRLHRPGQRQRAGRHLPGDENRRRACGQHDRPRPRRHEVRLWRESQALLP